MADALMLRSGLALLARLRNRPDREHEMALNRLAFCVLIGVYLWFLPSPGLSRGMLVCAAYGVFAIGIVAALLLRPGINHPRRILALLGDLAALGVEMNMSGGITASFYPLYLWVIFGNGFRFGLRYLFLALSASLVSFGCVVATTPYWRSQPLLSCSLLLALLILPAYAGSLIRKLSEAKRVAEEASLSKSRFLANVSHELRTPLNAILGSTSLLRGTPLGSEQRELTDALEVGTRALLSLISGILDFSRIEADRMPLRLEPLDLPDLLADIRELLGPQARLKNLRLRFHVSPRVPEIIHADQRHLHEVLLNLASNAIKFTAAGQVVISVDATRTESSRLRLRFEVADTGIGIRPEACERIFESFTQAEPNIIDRFGGTGLGLAIARQLVTLMGGQIAVDSTPGVGSTFWFTIDCNDVLGAARDTPPPDVRIILLCEDALLAARIRRQVAPLALEIERANDEQDAAARLSRQQPADGRKRTLLLLQRSGVHPDASPDAATATFLASIGDVPVIAVADPGDGPERPGLSFRSSVGTWVPREVGAPEFRLALRKVAGRPVLQAAADWPGSGPATIPARRLHVLVADDNDINLRVVAKVLERAGHSMRLVRNGLEALEALDADRFDIVLMDVNMPVMNGIEATKLYRFECLGQDNVPIVALTADATPDMEQACRAAGMNACLTKPVEVFQLAATLEALARPAPLPMPDRVSSASSDSNVLPLRQPAQPVFDQQVLANLKSLGGAEFVDEMLHSFAADAEQLVRSIGQAARDADLSLFRNQTHALRSCASNVGALAIQGLCGQCRDLHLSTLRTQGAELARRLADEMVRLDRSLKAAPSGHDVFHLVPLAAATDPQR